MPNYILPYCSYLRMPRKIIHTIGQLGKINIVDLKVYSCKGKINFAGKSACAVYLWLYHSLGIFPCVMNECVAA